MMLQDNYPVTRVCIPRGMYAISLQGSKKAYLEPLEKIFCAAPAKTASIRGEVPNLRWRTQTSVDT